MTRHVAPPSSVLTTPTTTAERAAAYLQLALNHDGYTVTDNTVPHDANRVTLQRR